MSLAPREPSHAAEFPFGSPESRLLFACLDPRDAPASFERIDRAVGEVGDWIALVRLADAHDVIFMLHRGLDRACRERPPLGIMAVLEDLVRRQREAGHRAWGELQETLALFEAAGISTMPLKGPVLARRLFGDVGARVSLDLDFLVRPQDVDGTLIVLEGAGYDEASIRGLTPLQVAAIRRLYGELAYTKTGRMTIEPHWALAQSTQAIHIDHEAIWARSQTVDLGAARFAAPAPECLFLMLVVHGSKEVWRKAKWLVDLAALAVREPGLDWSAVRDRARQAGVLRMVHVAWLLTSGATGIELPEPIRSSLARDPDARSLATRIARRVADGNTSPVAIDRLSALRWHMRERFRDRQRYALRTLTTPRPVHYRLVRIPDAWISLYVPLKLVYDYLCVPAVRLLRVRRSRGSTGNDRRPRSATHSTSRRDGNAS